ncbi:hypothetical protein LCGC14_2945240, partial [marine sediment metagenome]
PTFTLLTTLRKEDCGNMLSKRIGWKKYSPVERFNLRHKKLSNGCWKWSGHLVKGYGSLWANGKHNYAHRFSYELYIGKIPPSLTIDHLCRNTWCVNPKHLEPVTVRENNLRGVSLFAINFRKTHCLKGHKFNTKNTYTYKSKVNGETYRGCRVCGRIRGMNSYRKLNANLPR